LIHFNAKNSAIATVRRDFQLSDYIVRFLIVKDDKIEDLSQIGAVVPAVEKDVDKIPEIPVVDISAENEVPVKLAEEA